jgi:hypothetical protein
MRAGSDGNMPNAAYADVYARIWELYQAGDQRQARDLHSRTLLLANMRQQILYGPRIQMWRM